VQITTLAHCDAVGWEPSTASNCDCWRSELFCNSGKTRKPSRVKVALFGIIRVIFHGTEIQQRLLNRSISVSFASLLAGCTTVEYLPPPQEMREQLGNVAIVSRPVDPSLEVDEPPGTGTGALLGAGMGAAFGLSLGVKGCAGSGDRSGIVCTMSFAVGVILAVPAALIGSVAGAAAAPPSDDVKAATISLVRALEDARPNQALQYNLSEEALRKRLCHLRSVEVNSLTTTGYSHLEAAGFGSVLEIQVRSFEVDVAGGFDPVLSPKLIVEARLLRAADGTELYRRAWLYWGTERDYFQMASDNAQKFRKDVKSAYQALAKRILRDLFLANTAEIRHGPEPGQIITLEAPTEHSKDQTVPASLPVVPTTPLFACPEVSRDPAVAALTSSAANVLWNGKWFGKSGSWSLYLDVESGRFTGRALRRGNDPFPVSGTISSENMVAGRIEDERNVGSLGGMFPNVSVYQNGRVQAFFELEKRELRHVAE